MPKELDERFGPTKSTLQEESQQETPRHQRFRFRIVPAIPLGFIGLIFLVFGVTEATDVDLEDFLRVWDMIAYGNWRTFGLLIYPFTAILGGLNLVAASCFCWQGRWWRFALTLIAAVILLAITAVSGR